VTLPLHAGMTLDDVDRVCAACAEILAEARMEPASVPATR